MFWSTSTYGRKSRQKNVITLLSPYVMKRIEGVHLNVLSKCNPLNGRACALKGGGLQFEDGLKEKDDQERHERQRKQENRKKQA